MRSSRRSMNIRTGAIRAVALGCVLMVSTGLSGFVARADANAVLVLSRPHTFHLPEASDLRFNWVHADLAALDPSEARELVVDAWRMIVPKKLSRAYDAVHPSGPG